MSAFEFVLIVVAIVAGFAISEVLASWGRSIRARTALQDSALYWCGTFVLLALIVRYIWLLWGLRDTDWQFFAFLLRLAPMLVLALAAFVIALPRGGVPQLPEHYFAQARPFYILLVVFLTFWTASDLSSWTDPSIFPESRRVVSVSPAQLIAGRGLTAAALLVLAHTRWAALHWTMLLLLLAALVALSFVAVPQLGRGAA